MPIHINKSMEHDYQLLKLKERGLLVAPLQIIVRNVHHPQKNTTFSTIEETYRIQLMPYGIRTEVEDLHKLIYRFL